MATNRRLFSSAVLLVLVGLIPTDASARRQVASTPITEASTSVQEQSIPPGTILPVILRNSISPANAKQGQTIRGVIAQDVPLAGGFKIHKGSKVEGQIVEVASTANGAHAKVSLQFTKVYSQGRTIPITTDLRAIAGFMAVADAAVPSGLGAGEGEVTNWLDTTQIGGDTVFGAGGEVRDSSNELVGKSLINGGVLVQVHANNPCRGAVKSNESPQALWVFSANACGVYGLSNVAIAHAGRTDPVGTIVLELQSHKTKIQDGAGLLLRVIG
jgi:hypothetical protein